jgi:hypothetical protein
MAEMMCLAEVEFDSAKDWLGRERLPDITHKEPEPLPVAASEFATG